MPRTAKRRIAKIHWWRAKNIWSVVFSDHCEHYKKLVLKAPLETVLQDVSPRAHLRGVIALRRHGSWAEVI